MIEFSLVMIAIYVVMNHFAMDRVISTLNAHQEILNTLALGRHIYRKDNQ